MTSISIVLATHQVNEPLFKCLSSLVAQSSKLDSCHLVVPSPKVAKEIWDCDYLDARFHIHVERSCTIAEAWNQGLNYTNSSWILFLDGDHQMLPEAIDFLADRCTRSANASIVFGHGETSLGAGFKAVDARYPTLRRLHNHPCLLSSAAAYRREAVMQLGGFNPQLKYWPEYELCIRASKAGQRFISVGRRIVRKTQFEQRERNGTERPSGSIAALEEGLQISRDQFGHPGYRWVLRWGRAQAVLAGHHRLSSSQYDRTVLSNAILQLTGSPKPFARLQVAARFAASELIQAGKRPKYLTRFFPSDIKNRFQFHFGQRLFSLQYIKPKACMLPTSYFLESAPTNAPTICITTPNLNQGTFIERTILSVVAQGYSNLEYTIQDGRSDDQSISVIQKYSPRLTRWRSEQDQGQSDAINRGFQDTQGEIMGYLNSDDVLLPGSLAYVAKYFQDHPDVDVLYGDRILINEFDEEVNRWILPNYDAQTIRWADYIPQETLFWRRRAWAAVGGIDSSFQFAMDWDLILRFRSAGLKFAHVPRYLGAFRITNAQKTSALLVSVGVGEMNRLRERELGKIPQQAEILSRVRGFVHRQRIIETIRIAIEAITNWFRPMVDWTAEMRKLSVPYTALDATAHGIDCKIVGPIIVRSHKPRRMRSVGEQWSQNPKRR